MNISDLEGLRNNDMVEIQYQKEYNTHTRKIVGKIVGDVENDQGFLKIRKRFRFFPKKYDVSKIRSIQFHESMFLGRYFYGNVGRYSH